MLTTAVDTLSPVLKVLSLAIVAALAPIHTIMVSAGLLIIIDVVTGIWAAYRRGERLRSSAFRRTVSKLTVYQLAIISGFLVQHFLLTDSLPIVNMVAGAIGLTELKSIFENVDSINGGSLLKAIIGKIGSDNDRRLALEPAPQAEPSVEPPPLCALPPPATAPPEPPVKPKRKRAPRKKAPAKRTARKSGKR